MIGDRGGVVSEVYLLGDGKPELKLVHRPLQVGDVVEFGGRAWRVRTEDRGTNGVAARFICVRIGALQEAAARAQPPA